MTIVQEPPDVPKWVDQLESSYRRLVESIQRANGEFHSAYHMARSACPAIYGLDGNFDQGIHHKNATMYAAALYARLGEDLSLKGVKVEIPASDLPEKFLPAKERDFKDPLSFSPIKLYQYLFENYAGKNASSLVQGDVSKAFTDQFGHGRWEFEDKGTETYRVPKLDRFIDKGFKQETAYYIGHLSTSVDSNPIGALPNHIFWGYDSRDRVWKVLENFANLLQLADRLPTMVDFVRGVANAARDADASRKIPYGHKMSYNSQLAFIFRKERLEVRFSVELLDIIRAFLLTHHPDFKKKE